jgi:excisionase family DNA binding protein
MVQPEVTYTLAEVAAMTHLALRTLERGCRAGRIEHIKLGRSRVMTRAQIDALLAQHTKPVAEAIPMPDTSAKEADRRRALARLQQGAA